MNKLLESLSQGQKRILVFNHDLFMGLISYPVALAIRFGSLDPYENYFFDLWPIALIVFAVKALMFYGLKLSRGIWKFSSTPDLLLIVKSVSLSSLISVLIVFLYNRLDDVPRSSFIIDWFTCIFLLGGSRFTYRIWKESRFGQHERINTLIVGAGEAAEQLIRDIKRDPHSSIYICGILDKSLKRHHRTIHGISILGHVDDLAEFSKKHEVQMVFIALPQATSKEIRTIADTCLQLNINVKTLPALRDIADGKIEVSTLRPVNVEDLLGRQPVRLDMQAVSEMLNQKTVLVTGAGGSIGSELCRQIAKFSPQTLVLFESCEFFIYQIELTLKEKHPEVEIIPIVGDVRDVKRIDETFSQFRPDIVFHAAAYKHVPMMEMNPREAIKTNVQGTFNIAKASVHFGVEKFVMVSTDKAVNPTNVMGATKRIAEMVCTLFQKQQQTHFTTVRFGNVLGSNGSVIPLFMKQIENGGPVTVTHPEITRFFMSIPEATQLVLQAGCLGLGGEIFVLDMGEPVKIIDLAKDLIKLSGQKEGDVDIVYTGLRPGEKLYEEVLANEENSLATSHEMVRKANTRDIPENFELLLQELLSEQIKDDYVRDALKKLVHDYTPKVGSHDSLRVQ